MMDATNLGIPTEVALSPRKIIFQAYAKKCMPRNHMLRWIKGLINLDHASP